MGNELHNSQPSSRLGGGRIRYLDVLRGFTMLLVVFQHVRYFSCNIPLETSPIAIFCITFRMPMFFFISGYIAYKTSDYWSSDNFKKRVLTKARVQLVPTFVFFSIFTYFQIANWNFPGGFWFTEVLFEMFLIYFTVAYLSQRNKRIEDFILFVIGAILFVVKAQFPSAIASYLCFNELGTYFLYFYFGLMARKHSILFFSALSNKWIITSAIIIPLFFLSLIYGPNGKESSGIVRLINGVLLVSVIFVIFKNSAEYWNKTGIIQNSFEYIGRRTLDIYMLHFFLLPSLPEVGEYLSAGKNIVVDFFIVGLLTLMVTSCTLLISKFLKTSPILAKYLFGVNPKKKITA